MSAPPNERGLQLLLEEYFNSEDDRFLETLRKISSAPFLSAVAERWRKDPRPWARQQIFKYLDLPLNCPGHQPVVKRLFKQAEENKDHEQMGALLVAFDRLVRRVRETRWQWDRETRDSYQEEYLVAPKNSLELDRTTVYAKTRKDPGRSHRRIPEGAQLFSYHTRYYLRRRAWRYFRRLGWKELDAYTKSIAFALARYTDEDLAEGENILDSWGLMQACFGKHPALAIGVSEIRLQDGHSLAELSPAPSALKAWQEPAAAERLLSLAWQAKSHLVRVWSIQLLCREHREMRGALEHLFHLLEHEDPSVQQFGAQLLEGLGGLEKQPVSFWLRLLQTENLEALERICTLIKERVSAERLERAQCLALACHRAAPVARLGLDFLKQRAITTPQERAELAGLADAKCEAVAGELARWALGIVGEAEVYDREIAGRFLDSPMQIIRLAAWEWLVAGSPGYDDPVLWSRLTETPYEDLRLRVVVQLEKREKLPGVKAAELTPVWCSVLLGVHRGGRAKLKAVRQVGEAIQHHPGQLEDLLPVLAVAVRSVRRPEARAGLAAVVSAVEAQPELAKLVRRFIPELEIPMQEAPA